ncbi:AraC family transcriptional regulator [Pseudoduganella buxea]|uniref:AraC family transcriptional regulator n=1 Tax=Pseudoduganella buxea TaxID=1949069 RepID=A0A6I3SZQ9_9BURK|nr:AraC family transcriptional regulator [Pseudoduganella buxea]MTV54594.1 helix-turn-helix domain-containing protein [Pseudoduganella buxea]GGB93485.1 AraC family transcriptional regulator [Pseudoduganella buxea]
MSQAHQSTRQQSTIALLEALAPGEGYTLSALEGVRFMRANAPIPRIPVLYEPSIVIVCQGRKRGYLGDAVYTYDPRHYLVLSVPLPFESETEASVHEPMLAVALRIDLQVAAELVLALEGSATCADPPAGIFSTPLDEAMSDALLRLLQALQSPSDARILGPSIVRELLYRVLTGPQGGAIHASLTQHSHFGKIGKALRRIHASYDTPIDVGTLAREAGMSVPAFHSHFKAVTLTTPIQYLKTTRLHKARLLMVQDGVSAATASHLVGYESPSQFSREFKRFFGRTPANEAAEMRNALIQLPAQAPPQRMAMQ